METVVEAVLLENESVLKKWLSSAKNVNEVIDTENTTLLHLAASNRKLVAAKMLLRKGADPNIPDKKGWTPFHCAAKAKEFSLCELLLEKGGNPSLPNSSHSTPTHYLARSAVGLTDLKTLKKCMEIDGDVNALGGNGEALLHVACLEAPGSTIDWLIAHGADASLLTSRGESTLHYAVRARNVEAVKVLLENGVPLAAKDQAGLTAVEEAEKTEFKEALEAFEAALKKKEENTPWGILQAKPPARRARTWHATCAVSGDVVAYGGQFKAMQYADQVLSFNVMQQEWKIVRTNGCKAPCVAGHTLTKRGDRLYAFGGHNAGTTMNSMLELDVTSWTWTEKAECRTARCYHSAAYDEAADRVVVFGGSLGRGKNNFINTMASYSFADDKWSAIQQKEGATWPSARVKHSAAIVGNQMFLFGGLTDAGPVNDIYVFNLETDTWSLKEFQGTPPEPRFGHSMTPILNGMLLIHGGQGANEATLDDVHILKLDENRWCSVPSGAVRPRVGHAQAYLEDKEMILFTGGDGGFLVRSLDIKKLSIPRAVVALAKREVRDVSTVSLLKEESKKGKRRSSRPHKSKAKDPASFSISGPTVVKTPDGVPSPGAAPSGEGKVAVSHPVVSRTKKATPLQSVGTSESVLPSAASPSSVARKGSVASVKRTPKKDSLRSSVAKAPTLNKKAMMERIEKLETFSNTLSKDVLELVKLVEMEFQSDAPLQDPKAKANIQGLMGTIQAFCVFNRPAKTWAGSAVAEKKPEKPQKLPFPRQHFVNMDIPPKRPQPDLSSKEGETADEKAIRKRSLVFNEILTTETDYVRDLAVTIGLYLKPLAVEYEEIVGAYEKKTLFKNVEELWEVNNRLLVMLNAEWEKPAKEQKVGDVFISMLEDLKKYKPYCANQVTTEETIERLLRENKEFGLFVDEVQKMDESNRQSVQSYLLKPFQRITRYPLLLRELLKNTPDDFADVEGLKKAIEGVNIVVVGANETTRVNEQMLAILEIQSKIVQCPDAPELGHLHQYTFMEEFQAREVTDVKKGSTRKCQVYLFKQMLLVARPSKNKLTKRFLFKVGDIAAVDDQLVVPKVKHPLQVDTEDETCVLAMNEPGKLLELMNHLSELASL